ncbi:type II secretion system protein GspM [Glaciimonas sp. Gout2]|uniref:type II secretion system protein GspM n=1 Tax=unclassified Glaciimonas TaxID=2644401 RepID=UPI002AB3A505|nr:MULTISPECIES: type II secretion system protein GspM [unclassified Glaciimonas]MDY7548314.1 type II secretion system protein GspM [Glaciimonas sp. CA11.2]MEB0010536.1 type II secretion system protein GspM [Glaciimonas sp. Cout2]MEB0083514.1 type II secretion system protein GspM [Glaciimonas sp. Gout2]
MNSPSNPLRSTWGKMRRSATDFWLQRNLRERRLLSASAIFIVLVIMHLLLIGPALSGRARLQKDLPTLRQQSVEMQSLTAIAATLSSRQAAERILPLSKETVEATLKSKGLHPQNVSMSGDIAKVQLSQVDFVSLLDWLDNAQKSAHWEITEANINALDDPGTGKSAQPGIVNASVTLVGQKHE